MTLFSSLYGGRLDREIGTDDSTVLFTTARRKAAVNEAAVEFAHLTNALTRWVSIPVVSGQQEYNLNSTTVIAAGDFVDFTKEPVEFVETNTVSSQITRLAGDDSLPRRDVPWLDQYSEGWQDSSIASTVRQLPSFYYVRIDGGAYNLGFSPVPSLTTSATAVVRVPYQALAPAMSADADVPFTLGGKVRADLLPYHQGLVHYAASQLEKLRRDDMARQTQLQLFLGYVSRYLQRTVVRGPRAIRQARNYFSARTK